MRRAAPQFSCVFQKDKIRFRFVSRSESQLNQPKITTETK
ncbi:hypothetical protein APY04_2772 [Hyphomicrobium sulfonivorans]|uniref:Uncharacterized protein n=1 Tax=Hyphomicrobium sulfonivorans TaxID=121290 RepID=A0A120CU13_HYPSL|nr:hypothetical protein APY04_2772 [Hyphomicrobium sulfonivorans]